MSIILDPVKSSQIEAIGFDSATQTLAVRFRPWREGLKSSVYHYANVTEEMAAAMRSAESIGAYFAKTVKSDAVRHPFTRIE